MTTHNMSRVEACEEVNIHFGHALEMGAGLAVVD
jgi:hypothetical protein